MKFTLRPAMALAALLGVLGFSGCLMSGSSHTTVKGNKFDTGAVAKIPPGQSKDYVLSVLGPPTDHINLTEGELWKWHYSETRKSEAGFIFIFGTENETQTEKTAWVEFKGDTVTRAWIE